MKSLIAAWQQKNKNGTHLEKEFNRLVGVLMTASSSEKLIHAIKQISTVVVSSDKVLVTMKKLEKWKGAIEDELLTDEVVSSFDVLKSQVLVITNKKEMESKTLADINKCQSIMMEKMKEKRRQITIEFRNACNEYENQASMQEEKKEKFFGDDYLISFSHILCSFNFYL